MFKHYFTTALRNFRRHWVTTSVNVVGLSLGLICFIGALSVVQYFSLDDTHFPGADRVYVVTSENTLQTSRVKLHGFPSVTWIAADQIRASIPELDLVARISDAELRPVVVDSRPHDIRSRYADGSFLEMFPLEFVSGNAATALHRPRSALLTSTAALRLFGTTNAAGRSFLLDGRDSITVDGVVSLPTQPSHITSTDTLDSISFELLISDDVLSGTIEREGGAQAVARQLQSWRSPRWATTYIRLPADASLDLSTATLRIEQVARQAFEARERRTFGLMPVSDFRNNSFNHVTLAGLIGFSWSTMVMLVATLIVLVSWLNYANLSTAIAIAHRREQGVHRVLGASRSQLIFQKCVEALLVVAISIALAFGAIGLLSPFVRGALGVDLTYAWQHTLSFWPLVIASIFTSMVACALAPIVAATRMPLAATLQGSRGTPGKNHGAPWLVGVQFCVAGALLIFAWVFAAQHFDVSSRVRGSIPGPVLAVSNDLAKNWVSFSSLREELLRQPHVISVSGSRATPWGGRSVAMNLSNSKEAAATQVAAATHFVSRGYFSMMGIGVLTGSTFEQQDTSVPAVGSATSIVIDQSAVHALGFASPQAAVGQQIYPDRMALSRNPNAAYRVVGVVEDRILGQAPSFVRGSAFIDTGATARVPLIRLKHDGVAEGIAEVRAVWAKLAPNYVLRIQFVDEAIDALDKEQRPFIAVLGTLTTLAFLIALMGLIGMSIHMANRRRHEIGVRKTLGAHRSRIVSLLLRNMSVPVLIGSILAWPLAYAFARQFLNAYAHRIELGPTYFVGGLVVALGVAVLSVSWCALRAAQTRPADVLRHE